MKTAMMIIAALLCCCGRREADVALTEEREDECVGIGRILTAGFQKRIRMREIEYLDSIIAADCRGADSLGITCVVLLAERNLAESITKSDSVEAGTPTKSDRYARLRNLVYRAIGDSGCTDREIIWIWEGPGHEPYRLYFAIAIENDSGYTNYCFGQDGRGLQYYGSSEISRELVKRTVRDEIVQKPWEIDSTLGQYSNIQWYRVRGREIDARNVSAAWPGQYNAIDSIFLRKRHKPPIILPGAYPMVENAFHLSMENMPPTRYDGVLLEQGVLLRAVAVLDSGRTLVLQGKFPEDAALSLYSPEGVELHTQEIGKQSSGTMRLTLPIPLERGKYWARVWGGATMLSHTVSINR